MAELLRGLYDIPTIRYFYKYTQPLPLEAIETEVADVEEDIVHMLREVIG